MQLTKIVPATRSAAIKNKRPAPTNAAFFPSAQMKNVRFKPNYPTETQAIQARTHSTQTLRRSGDYRQHRNCTNYIPVNPRQPNQPRRSGFPSGEWRGVGEVERDSQIHLYLSDRPREDLKLSQRHSCINRIPDKRPGKHEASAPIPVHIQVAGTSPGK